MGAIPTNFLKLAKHSSCDNCGDFELFELRLSVPPFCFLFCNLSRTLARFLSACRCLKKDYLEKKIYLNLFLKKDFHSELKHVYMHNYLKDLFSTLRNDFQHILPS